MQIRNRAVATAAIITMVLAFVGVTANPALASSACTYDVSTGTVFASISGAATLSRTRTALGSPGTIQLDGVACRGDIKGSAGIATVATTEQINVIGSSDVDTLTITLVNGPFGTPSAWIPISVNLGAGADTLSIVGSAGVDTIYLGTSTGGAFPAGTKLINLNGGVGPDLVSTNVEKHVVRGLDGADVISGGGQASVGGPFTLPLTLNGGPGNDQLTGGSANDTLVGAEGNDIEQGGLGNDVFDEGVQPNGGDQLVGGAGTDTTSYKGRAATDPITVTLDGPGSNNDGSVGEHDDVVTENVIGGAGNDTLVGNGNPNALTGGPGIDTLRGNGGADVLNAMDGVAGDTVDGGVDAVADTCKVDVGDIVTNCP